MEIPKIDIPQIQIKEIYIPKIRSWEIYPTTLDIIDKPTLAWPVLDVPTLKPLEYNPDKFTPVEPEKPFTANDPIIPEFPEVKIPPKKEKEFFVPCPDPQSPLRVGSFANDDRIEKIKSFYYNEDKTQCLIEWEEVTYYEKLIPSIGQFTSVFTLALVGCSAPLVLNLIKPLVKKAIAKLQKSKGTKTSKQD